MMNKESVILDGNHLAYRAYYKFANLRTIDGVNTSIIYGIPYIVESLIRRLNPLDVVIVFDGGHSAFRKALLPDYKKRDKKLGWDAEDFHRQKDAAGALMSALGVTVVHKKGYEADDLIAMLVMQNTKKGIESVIVSGDKDFNQLINDKVVVYNVQKGIRLTKDNLKEHVGYTPKQCLEWLSIMGDKSDNIPGYPGMGPKRTAQIFEQYGSVRKYLKSNKQFGKIDNKKLTELMRLNHKLIGLIYFYRKFLKPQPFDISFSTGIDELQLKRYCNLYETNSFLKPQFLKTYKKAWLP